MTLKSSLLALLTGLCASVPTHAQQWGSFNVGTAPLMHVNWIGTGANGLAMAVGGSSSILTSRDGLTWTQRHASGPNLFYASVHTGSRFVVVGTNGRIETSTDTTTWTIQGSGTNQHLLSVAWTGSQLVAVGYGGVVLTSPNGTDWTKRNLPAEVSTVNLDGVTWNGSQLLAVGANGTVLTSTNGIDWTKRNTGVTDHLRDVARGTPPVDSGTHVAVGSSGTILTSHTGVAWKRRQIAGTGSDLMNAVHWRPVQGSIPAQYMVGGSDGAYTSTTGLVWTPVTAPTPGGVNGITWTGSRYILVGNSGQFTVSYTDTLPAAPTLVSPAQDSMNTPVIMTFSWNAAARARSYTVQTARNSAFTEGVSTDSNLNVNVLQFKDTLAPNLEYYWRVRAANYAGPGAWSEARRFFTQLTPPAAPLLVSPAANAGNLPPSSTFTWAVPTSVTTVHLQIAPDTAFNAPVFSDSTLTESTYTSSALNQGATYYWRARAKNAAGWSVWSEKRRFSIEAAPTSVPGAPQLTAPAAAAINVSLTTSFTWTRPSTATGYRIEVVRAGASTSPVLLDSTLTSTSRTASGLASNSDYQWRVQARNAIGWGAWSGLSSFKTILTAPAAPGLVAPGDYATGIPVNTTLTWAASAGAATYHVQVSTNPQFGDPNTGAGIFTFQDSAVAGTSRQAQNLAGLTQYYWRARAKNTAGVSPWSTPRLFTTAVVIVDSVPPSGLAPGMVLAQSSAHGEGLRVRFALARAERVRVRVLAMDGTPVAERDARLKAGAHVLEFPALGAGVHVLDVRAESFRRTLKLHP